MRQALQLARLPLSLSPVWCTLSSFPANWVTGRLTEADRLTVLLPSRSSLALIWSIDLLTGFRGFNNSMHLTAILGALYT